MYKKKLAEKIIEIVDNFRSIGDSEQEVLEAVESMLDPLEPKDKDSFSQWGSPKDRKDPKDCWDQKHNPYKQGLRAEARQTCPLDLFCYTAHTHEIKG